MSNQPQQPSVLSIAAYVGVAFAISWVCWLFVALTGTNAFTDIEVGTVVLLGGFGPTIAAIIFVWRTKNPQFQGDYWQRVFDLRRIKPGWLLPILLLYPGAVLIAFIISGTSIDFSPFQALLQNPGSLFVTLVFVFIFGPFAEELGWRGYLLERLQIRYSALVASLIVGVIWWAWHLPTIAVEGMFLDTTFDPVFLAGYFGTLLLYSVLFTWVYNNNQFSVMAAILMHFSINLTSRLVVMPAEIFAITTGVLIVVVLAVIVSYGAKHLVRETTTLDNLSLAEEA
ncbi:MAG: CPBP family intramembrane metalloprotease [Chloroflexi bacterium]|nr:CPBP family intramembrane metalloprotease [Chloroflexota bacterium]